MANIVYIATSLDGYIADKDNKLDWLHEIPNPDQLDLGWSEFMGHIDAIVMGRKTFDTVCNFECEWPYTKPVFVLSNSLAKLPKQYVDKAEVIKGSAIDIVKKLKQKGFNDLYIDGGKTIQGFFEYNLIDEITITKIPILLGGGISLFGELPNPLKLKHVNTEILLDNLVKSKYVRIS